MALFSALWMVIKQISRDIRLEMGLLLGLIVGVAIASAIPIYTEGSLEYALFGQLKAWSNLEASGRSPFFTMMTHYGGSQKLDFEEYAKLEKNLAHYPRRLGLPLKNSSKLGEITDRLKLKTPRGVEWATVNFRTDYLGRIEMVRGRAPSPEPTKSGEIEAMVDMAALDNLELVLGRTYEIPVGQDEPESVRQQYKPLRLKLVGVFRIKKGTLSQPGWIYSPPFSNMFLVDERAFTGHLIKRPGIRVSTLVWYWGFDHEAARVNRLGELLSVLKSTETSAGQILPGTGWSAAPVRTLEVFQEKASRIRMVLFTLTGPIIALLLYYVALTAGLLVGRRESTIVTMRSRGAGMIQLLATYTMEWGILAGLALIAGPPLGMLVARMLGASSGFLRFVDRKPIPVRLSPEAYQLGLTVAALAVVSALIPVALSGRRNIVSFKQESSRSTRPPFWKAFYLDVLFVGLSLYGYRALSMGAVQTGSTPEEAKLVIDPSLFLVPVLFIFAGGLLFLRIYPLFLRLAGAVTTRWSGPAWSMTLFELGRNPAPSSALMLLLITTTSMGVYGASTARTIDQNTVDRVSYAVGADAVFKTQWAKPKFAAGGAGLGQEGEGREGSPGTAGPEDELPEVYEPPFYIYEKMPGVAGAARVLRKTVDVYLGGSLRQSGTLMAIDPNEFARVAWFRKDLVPHHLNSYLNLLISNPEGVFVSRSFAKANSMQPGNWLTLRSRGSNVEFYMLSHIDQWPTLYPEEGPFFIGNINYVQQVSMVEPYDVWLKFEHGARLRPVVEKLRDDGTWVTSLEDLRTSIADTRREPERVAFFGMLSASFVISVLVSVVGFLLYSILSLRRRVVQFGVLRTIGLSIGQLVKMLSLEQLLTTGAGVIVGTFLGYLTSRVFLPFIQMSVQAQRNVPRFLVVVEPSDVWKIYAVLGPILILALINLAWSVFRLKPYAAIKLGEDT